MFKVKNISKQKTLSVNKANDPACVEVAWHDGQGWRGAWFTPEDALAFAENMAAEAAKAIIARARKEAIA